MRDRNEGKLFPSASSLKLQSSWGMQHLYRHFDKDDVLLYVGVSLRVLQRLGQHKANSHWFVRIAKVTLENYDSREAVLEAERQAILSEKPLHNYQREKKAAGRSTLLAKPTREESPPTKPDLSRAYLVNRMVQFKPLYKAQEVSKLLGINTVQIHKWMSTGKLGWIPVEGVKPHPKYGDRPPKIHRYVSGWQLIDFIEWLEQDAKPPEPPTLDNQSASCEGISPGSSTS